MCGIVGSLQSPPVGFLMESAIAALRHRGPDAVASWSSPDGMVQLGHSRLSILDLSAAGNQPMVRRSGGEETFVVVFNGEIYNFRELRGELAALGESFLTTSDTEVVLAAYARWGVQCLSRFNGMFAFALWDARRRELLLARDRLGIKPLYYSWQDDGLVFASEIKAVLSSGLVKRRVDRQAVADYLSLGSVLQPRTIVEGVRMLEPASWKRFGCDGPDGLGSRLNLLGSGTYWDLELEAESSIRSLVGLGYSELRTRLRKNLEGAMQRHLVADVPVGAFLSGGIDSTLVVGLASKLTGCQMQTFSIGFERKYAARSELFYAARAAREFNTCHHEVVLTAADLKAAWPRLIQDIDQPSNDGINTWFVSRAARERVKVTLSGLGADEFFAGYPHFRELRDLQNSFGSSQVLAGFLREVGEGLNIPQRLWRPLSWRLTPARQREELLRLLAGEATKRRMLNASWREEGLQPLSAWYAQHLGNPPDDIIRRVTLAEMRTYLRNTLLRDSDAMSMAHGLELRPVLLDHELVEFGYSLPGEHKLSGKRGKNILIDACADLLPDEIINRPKQGFNFPLEEWLRECLRDEATELFESETAQMVLSLATRQASLAELKGGSRRRPLWHLFVLLAYIQKHALR